MVPSLVVSDEDQRETAPLGETDQRVSRASYLRNRAGSGFEVVEIHGLDGIDDDKPRRIRNIKRRDDIAHVGGCGELNRCFRQPQPVGAYPDLVDRFLAGDIGACRFLRDRAGHLEKDRRFTDADHRPPGWPTGHQPAACDAIELGNAGNQPRGALDAPSSRTNSIFRPFPRRGPWAGSGLFDYDIFRRESRWPAICDRSPRSSDG